MPLLQGGGAPALPNFGGSLLFMHTPFDAQLPKLTWQHMWGGACFMGQSCPRDGVLSTLQFWGLLFTYVYNICRRTTKFHVVTHMGRGLF